MIRVDTCNPWPIDLDCTDCNDLPADIDPALIERWRRVASTTLWRLSGRRWGPCPITVRPCRRSCADQSGLSFSHSTGELTPYIHNGEWYNASLCGCRTDCSCVELCEVRLEGPVYAVTEVLIDGAVLDPADYRVDQPGRLVRTDDGCWPSCQDMRVDCDQPGAFCVTYEIGLPLDDTAIAAVSTLTCELLKACLPKGTCGPCRLPSRVQRATRQGVTMDFIDTSGLLEKGLTGLDIVDQWLFSVNPHRLWTPSRVMSPDVRPNRTTIWPG